MAAAAAANPAAAAADVTAQAPQEVTGGVNPWLIAASVMLATFMEVLDTSIAAVALPYIAGSLSATNDEATWVLTSYLVANAIILPASNWFSLRFGGALQPLANSILLESFPPSSSRRFSAPPSAAGHHPAHATRRRPSKRHHQLRPTHRPSLPGSTKRYAAGAHWHFRSG